VNGKHVLDEDEDPMWSEPEYDKDGYMNDYLEGTNVEAAKLEIKDG